MHESSPTPAHPTPTRRQFLRVLTGGVLFVAIATCAFVWGVTRPLASKAITIEKNAVHECWRSARRLAQLSTSRSFQDEACREMEKQFTRKFGVQL